MYDVVHEFVVQRFTKEPTNDTWKIYTMKGRVYVLYVFSFGIKPAYFYHTLQSSHVEAILPYR